MNEQMEQDLLRVFPHPTPRSQDDIRRDIAPDYPEVTQADRDDEADIRLSTELQRRIKEVGYALNAGVDARREWNRLCDVMSWEYAKA